MSALRGKADISRKFRRARRVGCKRVLRHKKHERPHGASVRQTNNSRNGKLEFGRHVAVGWQVAVDFETDADFDQNGCRPGHSILPLDLRENNRAEEHGTSSIRSSGGLRQLRAL